MGSLKVSEVYSKNDVKFYGALGDGKNDDTNALIKALNSTNNLFFDQGIYVINKTLVLKSNTYINGKNATIKLNGSMHLIEITPDVSNVTINNVNFDGNGSIYSLLYIEGHSNTLSHCKFYNTGISGHGICFDGQRSKVCKYNNVDKCYFNNILGIALSNNMSQENIFTNNYFINSGKEAITLDNYSRFTIIKNNIIRNSCINESGGVGSIGIDASSFSIISENIISQCNNRPGITTQTNIHGSNYNTISGNIISGLDTSSGKNYGIEIHSHAEDSSTVSSKHSKHNLISSNITQYGISTKPENILSNNIAIQLPVILQHYDLTNNLTVVPNFSLFNDSFKPHKIYSNDELANVDIGFKTGPMLIRLKTMYNLNISTFNLSLISFNEYYINSRYSLDNGVTYQSNSHTLSGLTPGYKSLYVDILYNNTQTLPHWTKTTDVVEITINGSKDYTDKLKRPGLITITKKKILCLHGGGDNANNFKTQKGMQDLMNSLDNYEFVFIDSPLGSGLWWDDPVSKDTPTTSTSHADVAINYIYNYINSYGPFYGLLGYSQGAAMACVFLAYKQNINFERVLLFNGYLPTTHSGLMSTINNNSPYSTKTLIFLGAKDAFFYDLGLNLKSIYSNYTEIISTSAEHHLPYITDNTFIEVKNFIN